MLYSWMKLGKDCYVSLQGEWALRHLKAGGQVEDLLAGRTDTEVFKEVVEEELYQERVFMDFTGIGEMDKETCRGLNGLLEGLLKRENEIYLTEVAEPCAECIRTVLSEEKIAYTEEKTKEENYCYAVYAGAAWEEKLPASQCRGKVPQICKENLLILMEEGSQGKFFNINRLLADEEFCLQYFFYKLTVKMAESGLISRYVAENKKLCLVPVNDYGVLLAAGIAEIAGAGALPKTAGTKALTETDLKKLTGAPTAILVRDVIHMSHEITGPAMRIGTTGAVVKGAVSLVDIHTGIGKRNKYTSLHTIDLEKGIGYHLRKKQLL